MNRFRLWDVILLIATVASVLYGYVDQYRRGYDAAVQEILSAGK